MFDPLRLLPGVTTSVVDPAPFTGRNFAHIFSASENPNLRPAVMRIIEEAIERPPYWQSAVRANVWEFMIALRRLVPLDSPAQDRKPLSRVAPTLEALARDCGRKWTMGRLAGLCCMSETNFRRVWKDTIGQSPQQYLIMMRMQMAAAILKSTDRPVTDVSLSVGFDSQPVSTASLDAISTAHPFNGEKTEPVFPSTRHECDLAIWISWLPAKIQRIGTHSHDAYLLTALQLNDSLD